MLYWENPEVFSATAGNFPYSAYSGNLGIVLWQESTGSSGGGNIRIRLAAKESGGEWESRGIIGGPYAYSGTEPSIVSAVIDSDGRIFVAVAASSTETEILMSEDEGLTFTKYRINNGAEVSVAPRIVIRSDGGYLLFITRGNEQSLSMHYALSDDGVNWTPFQAFVTEPGMQLNFLPSYAVKDSVDYVVFQSFMGGADSTPAFQLFVKTSTDGGNTWSPSERITSFQDSYTSQTSSPDLFDNQRPHLSVQNDSLFLVWERRFRNSSPQIYAARLDENGMVTGAVQRINSVEAYCNNPIAFDNNGEACVIWFDNRRGQNRIFLAQEYGPNWIDGELGPVNGESSFGRPIVEPDGLHVFWQATIRGVSRIYALNPDKTVDAPQITARNFTAGTRTRAELARLSWNVPSDSSGIMGFSYSWSLDEDVLPEKNIRIYNQSSSATAIDLPASGDGSWYFTIAAQDFAGNWSSPSRVEFIRDTVPPPAAVMIQPATDESGFLTSNTFELRWNPPPASDVAGYVWNLQYLGSGTPFRGMDDEAFQTAASVEYPAERISAPRVQGTDTTVSYTNRDNGAWRFVVQAVDEVGNIGPLSSVYFRTDKYIPHTYITWVDAVQDEQGILRVHILGRGFSENGNITRITLEKDGDPPWIRNFYPGDDGFRVVSDREIDGIRIDDIDEGRYRIILEHPVRGIYSTAPLVSVDETGTVKFGDYSSVWEPSWLIRPQRRFALDTGFLVIIAIYVFCVLGLLVSLRGIGETMAESAAIKMDAVALITGDFMPSERKKRIARIKRRGIGLRFKMTSFTASLVLAVVVMISIPLYLSMMRTQRETLLEGLWYRSVVLLEGLAANARAYLPQRNVLELGFLPGQMESIPEANYVTITGFSPETTVYDDQVWATNDPNILAKIDTVEFQPGVSRITDVLSPRVQSIADELNTAALKDAASLSETIVSLEPEAREIAAQVARTNNQADIQRLEQIQTTISGIETRLNEILSSVGSVIGSEPAYSMKQLTAGQDNTFILFKPIMYRQGSETNYFRGLIRLEISVESIAAQIRQSQLDILVIILPIAIGALAIGAFGALILAAIIILPIRRLVSHVERIRDTENMADLDGVDIKIKSHDEIAVLGNTINDMTHGLVKAAAAASDLSIGKEIQKKFIPLETDREGNKLSSGFADTKNASFFGYYEGAKGVSGDYFDYRDLDGRYFAIIKCDVAGKGIPAALIMIQVATMFLNYFKQWKPSEKAMHIESVVYQINDFIETLGFKGRFAAFTLCLFDTHTGIARFCNAGDNIVHLFRASDKKLITITTPQTPATGVLPNFIVESKGGYAVQAVTIERGDILLLYTDGIEEAKRKFRDPDFREILCAEGPADTPHENHSSGQGDEEMGFDRVSAIVNAVMNRETYTLHKWHNPEGDGQDLTFDFTGCKGTEEEAIMAMVSVEKMFRCYKNPDASEDDRVIVDRKVDAFLREHFRQYRNYCSFTREIPANNSYLYYTHLKEDEQYDDLTILGVRRK